MSASSGILSEIYISPAKPPFLLARPAGFEPATRGLEERGGVFAGVS